MPESIAQHTRKTMVETYKCRADSMRMLVNLLDMGDIAYVRERLAQDAVYYDTLALHYDPQPWKPRKDKNNA